MKAIVCVLTVVVVGINIYFLEDYVRNEWPHAWWVYLLVVIYGVFYLLFIAFLTAHMYGVFGLPGFDRIKVGQVVAAGRGLGVAGRRDQRLQQKPGRFRNFSETVAHAGGFFSSARPLC